MSISYIIPTCGEGNLNETIDSILNQKLKPFEIIIIENGVRLKDFNDFRKIHLKKNYGYSRAVNLGILCAKNKFLAIVNDDIILPENWTEEIINEFEKDKKIGACSSFIKKSNGLLQIGSVEFNEYLEPVEVQTYKEGNLLNFAAVVIPMEVINKIGLLDENFFVYYEDVDYSLRILRNGFKLKAIEKIYAYHKVSSSSKIINKEYHLLKNKHYLIKKNFGFSFYLKKFTKIFKGDLKILKKKPYLIFYYPFLIA